MATHVVMCIEASIFDELGHLYVEIDLLRKDRRAIEVAWLGR